MWYLGSIESKSDSQGTIAEATHSLVARRGGRQSLKGGAWWWFSVGGSQVAAPGLESIGWLYGKTMFHLTPLGVPGSGPKRKYRRVSASVAIRDKKQCETGVMIQLITSIDAIAPVPVQPTGITSFSSCKRKKRTEPKARNVVWCLSGIPASTSMSAGSDYCNKHDLRSNSPVIKALCHFSPRITIKRLVKILKF